MGGIPFWEESHFGRDPGREEFRGRDPGREEFLGRNPVFLLCRKIQIGSFRSDTRRTGIEHYQMRLKILIFVSI